MSENAETDAVSSAGVPPSDATSGAPTPSASSSSASAASGVFVSSGSADPDLWTSGILAALKPGVEQCDQQIAGVFEAQNQLATQIDRLTAAISAFHSSSRSSSLQPYTTKLITSKKRIKKCTSDIAKVQARLDDIRTMVRKKEGIVLLKEKSAGGSVGTGSSAVSGGGLFGKLTSKLSSSKEPSPNRSRAASTAGNNVNETTTTTTPNTNDTNNATPTSTNTETTATTTVDAAATTAPATVTEEAAATVAATPETMTSKEKIASLLNWQ